MNANNEFTKQIFAELEQEGLGLFLSRLTEEEFLLSKTLELKFDEFLKADTRQNYWFFKLKDGKWNVQFVGRPEYFLDPGLIEEDEIGVEDVLENLRQLLPGIKVEIGDSTKNRSEFVDTFRSTLEKRLEDAISRAYFEFDATIDAASNPYTPICELNELARHHSPYVRFAIAQNPSTPVETLENLSEDTVIWVAEEARRNPDPAPEV